MLSEIGFNNFKCFEGEVRIPVRRLNILTGLNGGGKSTVLQSLLLMRQSIEHNRTGSQIVFNGNCIALGRYKDVKNSYVPSEDPVQFIYTYDYPNPFGSPDPDAAYHFTLTYTIKENRSDDSIADIMAITGNGSYNADPMTFEIQKYDESGLYRIIINTEDLLKYNLNLFNMFIDTRHIDLRLSDNVQFLRFILYHLRFTAIHYISADRIGPKNYFHNMPLTDFPNVGTRGEYTASLLQRQREEPVHDNLYQPEGETSSLIDQVEAWLSRIFKGGRININLLEENILSIKMNSDSSKRLYKPANIGFGYSYVLPIIVSCLVAKAGEILIVENPEAHLHPAAQAQLAKLLSIVSSCGVQVFIETHSDHIVNAIRLAVKNKIVTPEEANVFFFGKNSETPFEAIPIQEDGGIEHWPAGFCDQAELDLEKIYGL